MIIATDDGLIGWRGWFASPPEPRNEHERVVKQWADHLAEPERKWEWYVRGTYSNDTFATFIANHLEHQHGIEPPETPSLLTDEAFLEFMLRSLDLHPMNHAHQ